MWKRLSLEGEIC